MSLPLMSPMVRAVAYTGALICLSRKGREPMWSSCPWVMKMPRTLAAFFSK